jgi:hypothetical protein
MHLVSHRKLAKSCIGVRVSCARRFASSQGWNQSGVARSGTSERQNGFVLLGVSASGQLAFEASPAGL